MTMTATGGRMPARLAGGAIQLLLTAISPIGQLAVFGAVAATVAVGAPAWTWTSITCWVATAAACLAIIHLVSGRRDGADWMLHTNTSAATLGIVQLVGLMGLWTTSAPDSIQAKVTVAVFAVLIVLDIADRAVFVRRVRRIGGVEAEARRVVEAIMRKDPEDAHALITAANVDKRDRSRLHWRLGEALSAENIALYERETAAGAGQGDAN